MSTAFGFAGTTPNASGVKTPKGGPCVCASNILQPGVFPVSIEHGSFLGGVKRSTSEVCNELTVLRASFRVTKSASERHSETEYASSSGCVSWLECNRCRVPVPASKGVSPSAIVCDAA